MQTYLFKFFINRDLICSVHSLTNHVKQVRSRAGRDAWKTRKLKEVVAKR